MYDLVLFHIVQGNEHLNGKSSDQAKRYSLEVVHLNKVVYVYREQFKCEIQVFSEHKLVKLAYNIFLVFRIGLV